MIKFVAGFAAAVALTTAAGIAQALDEPVGYTGTIVAVADESVTLQAADGKVTKVAMTRGWHVAVMRPVGADAIQVNSFIGAANSAIDERTGKAVEFRIFEPGNKPEQGTHAMGGRPTLMTHGTVTNVKATEAGREVDVVYPGGERRIIVPRDVEVRQSFVVDQSRAQAGAVVTAVTRKDADGVWRATRLLISETSR
jgi:hypothetical protein